MLTGLPPTVIKIALCGTDRRRATMGGAETHRKMRLQSSARFCLFAKSIFRIPITASNFFKRFAYLCNLLLISI